MKHKLGIGTINVSVNLLIEERRILGQIAARNDQSMSGYLRQLVSSAIRQVSPEAHRLLSNARRLRRERQLERFAPQLSFGFA